MDWDKTEAFSAKGYRRYLRFDLCKKRKLALSAKFYTFNVHWLYVLNKFAYDKIKGIP